MPYDWTDPENQSEMLSRLTSYLDQGMWKTQDDFTTIVNQVLVPFVQNSPNEASRAFEVLADAEVRIPELRLKYCETGLLADVLWRLEQKNVPQNLAQQYLRIIGNSLDEETGRCRGAIAPHIHRISGYFYVPELAPLAMGVILNACIEPGPTRSSTIASGLDSKIASGLHDGTFPSESAQAERALLVLETLADDLPDTFDEYGGNTLLTEILRATAAAQASQNHANYARYIALLLKYLTCECVQQAAIQLPTIVAAILAALESNIESLEQISNLPEREQAELVTGVREALFEVDESNISAQVDSKLLQQVFGTTELSNSLTAISQMESFHTALTEQDLEIIVPHAIRVLKPAKPTFLENARISACISLGNLAASPKIAEKLVADFHLDECFIEVLKPATDRYLLLAGSQCLFRLAHVEQNRTVLGKHGVLPLCVGLLTLRDPRVQPEAAATLRVLLTDNIENAALALGFYEEGGAPSLAWTQESTTRSDTDQSILSLVLREFERDAELADLAILVVEMIKTLNKDQNDENTVDLHARLASHPDAINAILTLVSGDTGKYPFTRGVFGLGLLCQSPTGAVAVVGQFNQNAASLEIIDYIIQSGATDASIRDNLRVSIHGIRQHAESQMSSSTRATIAKSWASLTTETV